MPIYRIRIQSGDSASQEQELGFYQDRAAADYARKLARGAATEVWRDAELVARFESAPIATPEPA